GRRWYRRGAAAAEVPALPDRLRGFRRWARDGSWQRIHDALRDLLRVHAGRDPAPSAAIIDSQSVNGADTVPGPSRGYDAGNHAGRAVMPGGRGRSGVAAFQRGARGELPA
ncbi:MAG: hypothetical protein ACRDS9_11665, partial [Pseudonocardiaceae bacterium]